MKHLRQLEDQSVYILREAYKHFNNLAMLWSMGKDSTVLLWLARKAFFGHVPFPLLHVDTSYKIPGDDRISRPSGPGMAAESGGGAKQGSLAAGMNHTLGRVVCCTALKTNGLKQLLEQKGYTALFRVSGPMKKARGQRSGIFLLATNMVTGIFATSRRNCGINSRRHFRLAPIFGFIRCWIGPRSTSGSTSSSRIFPSSISYLDKGDGTRYRSLGCAPCTMPIKSTAKNSRRNHRRAAAYAPWPSGLRPGTGEGEGWSCCEKMGTCEPVASRAAQTIRNLNIVIVGHVDHGKSTLLGRLYADTGSLPDGKLEKVQAICRQQGKEFEYAFLFDAFLEEQEQGITIDTARTFFIWKGRQYIIIDAPGHKEFLKNMISGAARAEAALLLIDALEGVKEQSKKHGYLLSLLGVRQFAVVVNKMDLVGYRQDVFEGIEKEYQEFLGQFDAVPERIIPVSAKLGDNIANRSRRWHGTGPHGAGNPQHVQKEMARSEQPLRLPVQDVYKFDARRIIAGPHYGGTAQSRRSPRVLSLQ